ncbi:MAG: hypothetical protein CMK63_05095 [Pseudoalteromonadaceae bacterium]|nr:hypothetical protein [Pseudoalteromonadaceae bacterium]
MCVFILKLTTHAVCCIYSCCIKCNVVFSVFTLNKLQIYSLYQSPQVNYFYNALKATPKKHIEIKLYFIANLVQLLLITS